MAHIRTLPGINDTGYDARHNVLVVPAGKTNSLYLVDTSPLGVGIIADDPTVATVTETDQTKALAKNKQFSKDDRTHPISRLSVKGLKVGSTTLRAENTVGADGFTPITVQVVNDAESRQSGKSGTITPELRAELQQLTLREAVLRVAEDQMYSRIGRNAGGFGEYADASYDWCGAFAWYCWNVACKVKGVPNPFGSKYNALLSCQKAVSWALQTDSCTILRYQGGDPYGTSFTTKKSLGKLAETQKYIEISPTNPVLPADIAILRVGSPAAWKHVCMVWESPTGDTCETIDGNQGNPCIARRSRSMTAKVNNGKDYELIFLSVQGID